LRSVRRRAGVAPAAAVGGFVRIGRGDHVCDSNAAWRLGGPVRDSSRSADRSVRLQEDTLQLRGLSGGAILRRCASANDGRTEAALLPRPYPCAHLGFERCPPFSRKKNYRRPRHLSCCSTVLWVTGKLNVGARIGLWSAGRPISRESCCTTCF